MQNYTIQDIMDLHPCQPTEDDPDAGYPESKLRTLFGDRQAVTLHDICDDERVPVEDRQWVLHRLLPEPLVHEAACRYAEHALERERTEGREPDPRSWAAIEAKRLWLRGDISDDDLSVAESAASASAGATASAAASAARASAWAAERRWQLATLRALIEEMEDRTHQRKGKQ